MVNSIQKDFRRLLLSQRDKQTHTEVSLNGRDHFVPIFLSTPAATAAKLGAKVGTGVGSGLWHTSFRYRQFMLEHKQKSVSF